MRKATIRSRRTKHGRSKKLKRQKRRRREKIEEKRRDTDEKSTKDIGVVWEGRSRIKEDSPGGENRSGVKGTRRKQEGGERQQGQNGNDMGN